MKELHKVLLYLSLCCTAFLCYLVASFLFPKFFDFVIVGVFHEMLTIPALLGSVLIFVYSSVMMFKTSFRNQILSVFLISLVNVAVIVALFSFDK